MFDLLAKKNSTRKTKVEKYKDMPSVLMAGKPRKDLCPIGPPSVSGLTGNNLAN
jgi:hypothetical protein